MTVSEKLGRWKKFSESDHREVGHVIVLNMSPNPCAGAQAGKPT